MGSGRSSSRTQISQCCSRTIVTNDLVAFICYNGDKGSKSLLGLGAGELGQFSPKNQHLVSLEIGEVLSSLLSGEGSSDGAVSEFFGDAFFGDGGSDLSGSGAAADLDNLSGEL